MHATLFGATFLTPIGPAVGHALVRHSRLEPMRYAVSMMIAILALQVAASAVGDPIESQIGVQQPSGLAQDDETIPEWPVIGLAPAGQPIERYRSRVEEIRVETLIAGLVTPSAIAFTPDGRILIAEQGGRIRVRMARSRLVEERPYAQLAAQASSSSGLLGLTIHPDLARQPYVYVMYTTRLRSGRFVNRISRLQDRGYAAGAEQILLEEISAGDRHNGGRLAFGPDRKLYIGTGDSDLGNRSQDPDDLGGKILRLNADGSIPRDNPWPDSAVWSLGHREVRGLAWHPRSGKLFSTELGPSGTSLERADGSLVRVEAGDEINVVERGGNHGWPLIIGTTGLEEFVDPIVLFDRATLSPTGMTFSNAPTMPRFQGDLFVATSSSEALVRVRFRDPRNPQRPTSIEHWFTEGPGAPGVYGRIRDVTQGPDGALYLLTGNRSNINLRSGEDRVLRIVAAY